MLRPGLEALRDLAAAGHIEAALVYSPDRLSLSRCGVEGAGLPVRKSAAGLAKEPVHELRDPAIFVKGTRRYLLYSVAGESGIAIAELK